ncbi:MAG: hypothetical protein KGP14_00910 [Betaproteobacteria bacterium]|nr:hypothetical protein [Betaproteobacteria bacterium]
MTDCLGCQSCEDGPIVTLISGAQVCNLCPAWRVECEARELLDMPLEARRAALADRESKRGVKSVNALKDVMKAVFEARRANG